MYYQYNMLDDRERMMDGGDMVSRFQVKNSDKMYVAYRQKQGSGYIEFACITRQNKRVGKIVLSLAYVKCEHIGSMQELYVETAEKHQVLCVITTTHHQLSILL